jgi:cyclopropane fatty-acyl-phospholipid synthase-like methyltransferase
MQMDPDQSFSNEIVDMWKTRNSQDYGYFAKFEEIISPFWAAGWHFRNQFDLLNCETVLEIACGTGRHTIKAAGQCGFIWAADTSMDALSELSQRITNTPYIRPLLVSDGSSLPEIESGSISAVFSYDAMVHFELLTVASYLTEISRVLRCGCKALLHHSNYAGNPEGRFRDNPGWRNFMTADIMRHLASRNGLKVISQTILDWNLPQLDALTVLQKD